jgi:Pyridoxal-phosphate dependent enzyme
VTQLDELARTFRMAAQEYDPAIPLDSITEHPENPNEGAMGVIEESMEALGFYGAILVQKATRYILVGNHRTREARALGAVTLPGFWLDVDAEEAARIMSVDNESTRRGHVNKEKLLALLRPLIPTPTALRGTGYTKEGLLALLRGDDTNPAPPAPTLADRFLVPPFDVLDARQGYWQARKKAWLSLGIRSEEGRLPNARSGESAGQGALYWGSGHGRSDPAFYAKKREAEQLLGRELSTHEFEFEHYEPIPDGVGSGKSIFDPVLCELAYRWFSPAGGLVIDPFAGGSVRGLVAGLLGHPYDGCDLSARQVEANREQAAEFTVRGLLGAGPAIIGNPAALTPIERRGEFWVKRDDLFVVDGSAGGKVRTCMALAGQGAPEGLITAGSRSSPQVNIVATIAARMGIACRVHVPAAQGPLTPELAEAQAKGAEIIEHRPGYNTVIVARAREDAASHFGWTLIPFGMEDREAVTQTAAQVAALGNLFSSDEEDLPRRVVVPVGSGMTLAGVLEGLRMEGLEALPVLGVVVGADPGDRLDEYAPGWHERATLMPSGLDYAAEAPAEWEGMILDPHYEAKCVPFLRPGDLLWVVGCRETARQAPNRPAPKWTAGDSASAQAWPLERESADLIFTCPPYYDLEVYSDEEGELSRMSKNDFDLAYADIIARCAEALRPDRFAVFVTGDSRSRKQVKEEGAFGTGGTGGALRDMRGATIRAAEAAGLQFVNGAVLVTPVGSIPITAARMFTGARTLARTHQDVLVFAKGDRAAAARACGQVEVTWPEGLDEGPSAVAPERASEEEQARNESLLRGLDEAAQEALSDTSNVPDESAPGDLEGSPKDLVTRAAVALGATYTVSAATLAKRLNCTLNGITTTCHGACCYAGPSGQRWPPNADPQEGGACHYLGPQGCTLDPLDKPVKCLLYPLMEKEGRRTLPIYFRAKSATCGGCYGDGPPLADALGPSLAALVGPEEAARFAREAAAGGDVALRLPPAVCAALEAERAEEEARQLPPPRSRRAIP